MKKYKCVEDYQGTGWCVDVVDTAEGWRERAIDWQQSDGIDAEDIEKFSRYYKEKIEEGKEQELMDYIADVWQIGFEEVKE